MNVIVSRTPPGRSGNRDNLFEMGSLSQSSVAGCMSEVRIGNRTDDGVLHQVQGLGQLGIWPMG